MNFWDHVKKFAQPYGDDEYGDYDDDNMDDYGEEEADAPAASRRPSPFASGSSDLGDDLDSVSSGSSVSSGFNGQLLNMDSNKQKVVIYHAKTFDDDAKAANELRERRAVILNMENIDKALTRRVVDFLSGAVYALDGSVKKVAQATYLFCPHNMEAVGDLENLQSEVASYL